MNSYEVLVEMGFGPSLSWTVKAENEKQARKIVWETLMNEEQKDTCCDLEVFLVED
jgi:hypothetical protein